MDGMWRRVGRVFQLCVIVALGGCDTMFSYSPYQDQVDPAYAGLTKANLALISERNTSESRTFKVALLSDPHYHYTKLHDALTHINTKNDISFVIVAGDLTDNGLMKEFVLFHEIMTHVRVPYLAVIGNHDFLSNGEKVYAQMYGDYNFTFVFNNTKFIVFNNVFWESESRPDFEWLRRELANARGYDHVIPVSHIPPFDGQMADDREMFHRMLADHNITTSVHGHAHKFSLEAYYGDNVQYHTISSPQKRTYSEMTVTPDGITFEKIEY